MKTGTLRLNMKWITIAASIFLGLPAAGAALLFLRADFGGWFFKPAMDAYAKEIIPKRDQRNDSASRSLVDTLQKHMDSRFARLDKRFDRLEALFLEMPEGRKAAERLKRKRDQRYYLPPLPDDRQSRRGGYFYPIEQRRTF